MARDEFQKSRVPRFGLGANLKERTLLSWGTMSRLFALILWFDDQPITGSVINLTNVKKPRKETTEYVTGDVVSAHCFGFGVCEGVLAKIDEDANSLKLLLRDGSEFEDLVKQFCPQTSKPPHDTPGSPKPRNTVRKASTGTSAKPKATKNKEKTTGQTEATRKKHLEKAANDLELTELSTITDRPSSPITHRLESSSLVGESLHVLNAETYGSTPAMPVPVYPPGYPTAVQDYNYKQLEARVQQLEERLLQIEPYQQWLWSPYQQNHVHPPPQPVPAPCSQVENSGPKEPLPCSSNNEMETKQDDTDVSQCTYNGFTKDQLRAKVNGMVDFSKVSKLLFRSLYSESEYRGRSLGGNKANKNFEARPSLGHPERLDVLYKIIHEMFPSITPAMVRTRLRDILKPSRHRLF